MYRYIKNTIKLKIYNFCQSYLNKAEKIQKSDNKLIIYFLKKGCCDYRIVL